MGAEFTHKVSFIELLKLEDRISNLLRARLSLASAVWAVRFCFCKLTEDKCSGTNPNSSSVERMIAINSRLNRIGLYSVVGLTLKNTHSTDSS